MGERADASLLESAFEGSGSSDQRGYEAEVSAVSFCRTLPPQFLSCLAAAVITITARATAIITVTAKDTEDAKTIARIRGLGFIGLLVQGGHHQPHHLAMAKGEEMPGHGH